MSYNSSFQKFQDFEKDFEKFCFCVEDLDHRLSATIIQAFLDCSGLEAMFKV